MTAVTEQIDAEMKRLSPIQKNILTIISGYERPPTLVEISHTFFKRPCSRKLIPQFAWLEKNGFIVCCKQAENCMELEYRLTEDGKKAVKSRMMKDAESLPQG